MVPWKQWLPSGFVDMLVYAGKMPALPGACTTTPAKCIVKDSNFHGRSPSN